MRLAMEPIPLDESIPNISWVLQNLLPMPR
jgi:hypothetical protein